MRTATTNPTVFQHGSVQPRMRRQHVAAGVSPQRIVITNCCRRFAAHLGLLSLLRADARSYVLPSLRDFPLDALNRKSHVNDQ